MWENLLVCILCLFDGLGLGMWALIWKTGRLILHIDQINQLMTVLMLFTTKYLNSSETVKGDTNVMSCPIDIRLVDWFILQYPRWGGTRGERQSSSMKYRTVTRRDRYQCPHIQNYRKLHWADSIQWTVVLDFDVSFQVQRIPSTEDNKHLLRQKL